MVIPKTKNMHAHNVRSVVRWYFPLLGVFVVLGCLMCPLCVLSPGHLSLRCGTLAHGGLARGSSSSQFAGHAAGRQHVEPRILQQRCLTIPVYRLILVNRLIASLPIIIVHMLLHLHDASQAYVHNFVGIDASFYRPRVVLVARILYRMYRTSTRLCLVNPGNTRLCLVFPQVSIQFMITVQYKCSTHVA